MSLLIRIMIPVLLLAAGVLGFKLMIQPEEPRKRPAMPPRAIKTRVISLARDDFQIVVRTQGIVRAHNEAALTSQVPGKVTWISPDLDAGAFFTEGEVLVELDDADFKTSVVAAEADLARAEAALAQEQARGKQARLNWEDLGYDEEPNELVLRLPQLREAEANVSAAQASLERAQRDLDRTKVRAPFTGRVLERTVALGQALGNGTALATIYGTDFVEVRLPIAAGDLAWLTLPEGAAQDPVPVTLSDTLTGAEGLTWEGSIVSTEGALDEESRELFAIARVYDPFELKKAPAERGAPLRVGQPVSAAIEGKVLESVFAVPRDAVPRLNTFFMVVDFDPEKHRAKDARGRAKQGEFPDPERVLQRREFVALWEDADYFIVRDDELGDEVVVASTKLVYAPPNAPVEIIPDPVIESGAEGGALAGDKAEKPAG